MTSASARAWPATIDPVIRKLGANARWSDGDMAKLQRSAERRERHQPGRMLAREGEATGKTWFMASGWACRHRILADGRRQIFGFLLPGDGLGVHGLGVLPALSSVVALTAVELIDGDSVHREARADPGGAFARALAGAERLELALLLDGLVRLGRQTAYERVAHLLLELYHRLALVGLTQGSRFPMPLTQEILADALGLSVVHVNRTLQQLRREGLIELKSGWAMLLAPDELTLIADYHPLWRGPAPACP